MAVTGAGAPPATRTVLTEAPRPKSPPAYPDFCGRHRLQVEVQVLNREIGFLQEELHSLEELPPASRCCKEVSEYAGTKSDPLIPMNRKKHKSCYFWRWIRVNLCLNFSWLCCSSRCSCKFRKPVCCCNPFKNCCSNCDLHCCDCHCTHCCCSDLFKDCQCKCSSCCCWDISKCCLCKCSDCCCCDIFKCCRCKVSNCCCWDFLKKLSCCIPCCGLPCCSCPKCSCTCPKPSCSCPECSECSCPKCSCPKCSCGCVFSCPTCTDSCLCLCPRCSRPCCVSRCLCP